MERSAKRQLIERNRETKQIRSSLGRWSKTLPIGRRAPAECATLIREVTAAYIDFIDTPLDAENNAK